MKMKLLVLGLLVCAIGKAQPVYNWARSLGSIDFDYVAAATSDASGNVYLTGQFNGTVDFDPGPGTQALTSTGDDTYICKFDATGNLVWAKSLDVFSIRIAVDAAGNVYTTGVFGGTKDFDPGPGTYSLTYAGILDVFVCKLDAAGNFVWAKAIGGTGNDGGKSIAVDATGNVYTIGNFNGPVDFDPGPGTQLLNGNGDFIAKLDASGNYVWAKPLIALSTRAVALDAVGNVYVTGHFFDATADFDPGAATYNLPYAGGSDIFISSFDASGNLVWAQSMGGSTADAAKSLTTDASGYIYCTGSFQGTVDFDPGPGTNLLTASATSSDIFVSKLDASGNLVWAKARGGSDKDEGLNIEVDALGNVYTSGNFKNTADFDPDAGTQHLIAAAGTDMFISKLDASGNYVWALTLEVPNEDFPGFVMAKGDDDLYVLGNYSVNVDFDPGPGAQNMMSAGVLDVFMVHLIPATLPLTLLQFQAENNGNAVQLLWQTAQEENTASFSIERSADGKSYTAIGAVSAVNKAAFKNNYAFMDAHPVTGTGFYRLKMIDIDGKYTHSHVVSVRRNDNGAALLVAPNPANNILYVQARGSEPVTVQIADVNGRILQQQQVTLNGNNSFSVNIQQLPSGRYYLLLKGQQLKLVQGFVKL